jgi:hypothetical protein
MIEQEQIAIMRHILYSVLRKWIKHYEGLPEVIPMSTPSKTHR